MYQIVVVLDLSIIIFMLIAIYKVIPFKNIEFKPFEKKEKEEE